MYNGPELNESINSFTDLNAWKKAHELVLDIYSVTKTFPREELFGLVSQMRRAGASVTSNIAEGFSRNSSKEKIQFYTTAKGSLTELQSQLMIGRDIGYMLSHNFDDLFKKSKVVHKLVNGLIKTSKSYVI
ncbi:MAG: hypothetical protein A2586_01995 [Candidatus Harrisonbacteria bacterium RIFOXYD1_FULL_40_9]|uniref:Four helix bundle protein n=1 Tax=Candidatus Harrisonbacteria bacterium RIFOXYD1_FULL_40_9 TaxID=1798412 RepID=A0A1G1ZWA3_9BACT|nr:MAG: hypothetical protein A2586_01995 [Candidatus Harrisonbacteria bacterium RIFOXYD1_FULL_40_9]